MTNPPAASSSSTSQTHSLPTVPTLKEMEDLKRQIANLTERNSNLASHLAKAEESMQGATKRAQGRYTEKIHANRRAERLEQDLAKEKWERNDEQLKAARLAASYQGTITQLREDIARAQCGSPNGTQLEAYQDQISQLQAHNTALQDKYTLLKTELDQEKASSTEAIRHLNDTIRQLSADLATEQAKKAAPADAPGEEAFETRIKEATRDIEKKAAESLGRQKLELAKQMQQRFQDLHSQKMGEMKQNLQQSQTRFLTTIQQLKEVYENEKRTTAALEQQVKTANNQIQWLEQYKQHQIAEQSSQISPGKRVGKYVGIPMTPQQSASPMTDVANKRRRLDSGGNFEFTTPDAQQVSYYSTPFNSVVTTPNSLESFDFPYNTDAAMTGFQMQGPMANTVNLPDALWTQEQYALNQQHISQPIMPPNGFQVPQHMQQPNPPPYQTYWLNEVNTMPSSDTPMAQPILPTGQQQWPMEYGATHSPSSQKAHGVRLQRNIDAARQKMQGEAESTQL